MQFNSNHKPTKSPVLRNLLLILLIITSIFTAITGTILKYAFCRPAGVLKDTFAMAVPFLLIHDSSLREDVFGPSEPEEETTPAPETEAETEETSSEAETESIQTGVLGPVDESYWNDVLFIGDSRTDGLRMYAPFAGADYFCGSSFSSYDIFDVSVNFSDGSYNLMQRLESRSYKAIYIMLGINEIGHSLDGIQSKFQTLIQTIEACQPNAYIILEANLKCSRAVEERNPELTQPLINNLNTMIAGLADNQKIFFIDCNPLFCDDEGYLKDELSKDGAHPYAANYQTWKDFLSQNGVQ